MIALLGDVIFDKFNAPTGWTEASEARYATIDHIGGRAAVQAVGQSLTTVELTKTVSPTLAGSVEAYNQITTYKENSEVLTLTLGNGVMVGTFVITALNLTKDRTYDNGELMTGELSISLMEYVTPPGVTQQVTGAAVVSNAGNSTITTAVTAPTQIINEEQVAAERLNEAAALYITKPQVAVDIARRARDAYSRLVTGKATFQALFSQGITYDALINARNTFVSLYILRSNE